VTYGDLMSLLLTFFVLLLSFSSIQESKFQEAIASLQEALGVFKQTESIIEFDNTVVPKEDNSAHQNEEVLYEFRKMEQYLLENDLDIEVDLAMTPDGINIKIKDSFLFPSASAKLQPEGVEVLNKIYGLLDGRENEVRVSGHTDSLPIHTIQFPSNWELSAARAIAVARQFNVQGLSAARLSATGYGEFRPLATNETEDGRSQNRRVEIFLDFTGGVGRETLDLPLESEVMQYDG
jgi:chemotaxis protein MotB